MQLTIACTAPEATALGCLLHENPAAPFGKELNFGAARVFCPEASGASRCAASTSAPQRRRCSAWGASR